MVNTPKSATGDRIPQLNGYKGKVYTDGCQKDIRGDIGKEFPEFPYAGSDCGGKQSDGQRYIYPGNEKLLPA